MHARFQALRGMRDVLPDEVGRWRFVERTAREVFGRFGYREIRTPLLEPTALFARAVGESSDIVRKEMYTFERGEESTALRPEATASVVRAFVEHALHREVAAGYPERLFYLGPMFRHERPQKGRLRQFHQIGAECIGTAEPEADAETLQMLDVYLDALGVAERELVVNSVGDERCRPGYRDALRAWLEPRLGRLCEDCGRRFSDNPLRVLDCKVEEDRRELQSAPRILDHLCAPCDAHFAEVRRALERSGVSYRVDAGLVRGLDYYRRTVFEVTSRKLGAQDAILGGGRYDGLVEEFGGPPMPALGFAIGVERLLLLVTSDRVPVDRVDAALIGLGAEGHEACRAMAARFRAAGLRVMTATVERPLGAQVRRAARAQARFAVFVGRDELAAARFGFKDLDTGEQEQLEETRILERLGVQR